MIDGRASKFDLKNTVIVLVTGLGLLGLSTMFCDFVLLNYSADRKQVCEQVFMVGYIPYEIDKSKTGIVIPAY